MSVPSPTQPPAPPTTFDALFNHVYERLKRIAHSQLARASDPTVSPTALVHEFYLRVAAAASRHFADPLQFLDYASKAMRHILIDRARGRTREKRGGAQLTRVALSADLPAPHEDNTEQCLDLELLLRRLRSQAPRAAQIVELHFYGGMALGEIAELMQISVRTVEREWRVARVMLQLPMD